MIWQGLRAIGAAFLVGLTLLWPACGLADEKAGAGGEISLELNRLDDVAEGCRMSFVLRNGFAATIDALEMELVLFDGDGQVLRLIAIDAGRLPAGKTRVKQFDVAKLACPGIGRVLINDVRTCKGDRLDPARCLGAVKPSARGPVELVN